MARKSKAQREAEKKRKDAARKANSRAAKRDQPDPAVEVDLDLEVPACRLLENVAGCLGLTLSGLIAQLIERAPHHLNPNSPVTPDGVEWIEWVPEAGDTEEDAVPQRTPQPAYVTREVGAKRLQVTIPESQKRVLNRYKRYSMGAVIELILLDRCRPIRPSEIEELANTIVDEDEWLLARSYAQPSMLVFKFGEVITPSGFHISDAPLDHKGGKYSRRKARKVWHKGAYVDPIEAQINRALDIQNERAANPSPVALAQINRLRAAREPGASILIGSGTLDRPGENTYSQPHTRLPRWAME